jgi:hypothetical protein
MPDTTPSVPIYLSYRLWTRRLRRGEKGGCTEIKEEREILMYWKERKMHYDARMPSELGKVDECRMLSNMGQDHRSNLYTMFYTGNKTKDFFSLKTFSHSQIWQFLIHSNF